MPKRHALHIGDWESIFGRLQELVLANSGEDDFQEIFKLLVAKIYDEMYYRRERRFIAAKAPSDTARAINRLIAEGACRWKGIIQGEPISRLRDEHLSVCVEAFDGIEILDSSLEVLDNLFEHLVSQSAKGAKGQYFTPRHVIDCCVRIVGPVPTETIIDPACGSAGFLIHALEYVQQQNPGLDVSRYCERYLWGCDFDLRAVQVAKALMLIAGAEQANIFRLNGLLTPSSNRSLFSLDPDISDTPRITIEDLIRSHVKNFKGFDIVVTNPPFAGEIREPNILSSYELAKGKQRIERDVLFLERCIKLLRPGGKLCIVLPHNKFGSKHWVSVRKWLLRHIRIMSVLGLGRNTFLPHTHQKASVLFGVKRPRALTKSQIPDEDILFLISEKAGKDTKGKIIPRLGTSSEDPSWIRADHDLDRLTDMFEDYVKAKRLTW